MFEHRQSTNPLQSYIDNSFLLIIVIQKSITFKITDYTAVACTAIATFLKVKCYTTQKESMRVQNINLLYFQRT